MKPWRWASGWLLVLGVLTGSAVAARAGDGMHAAAEAALARVFADADAAALELDPLEAMFRGDHRHAADFGDYITPDYYRRLETQAREALRRLEEIDRRLLSRDQRIAYDTFAWQKRQLLELFDRGVIAIEAQLPIDHFSGLHMFYPEFSSGRSVARFRDVADYENGLARLDGYARYLERAIVRMREGMASGHAQPKLVMERVLEQLDYQLRSGVDDSPFFQPAREMPAGFDPADRERLTAAYRLRIGERVFGAYRELQDFIRNEYLPACRDGAPGLVTMPDGAMLYQARIERATTLGMTAAEIHAIGLAEVERITREMNAIRIRTGFTGTLHEFFSYLRTDPRFRFADRQALLNAYEAIRERVDKAVPRLFAVVPRTAFEIRPVPAYSEKTDAAASYRQGTPDGERPGVFFVNTHDLPSRTSSGMETLFLHEAMPGHHFQISLAQENETLPNFLRFGGNTAFVEGWALYAESLGPELGMFIDPYQAFGNLDDEMLRAMRLVVDTGIHALGWSREQAIAYMLEHSAQSETDARAEVERYIAIPGQALAYKIGAMTIRRLRDEAESALGERFDPRAFHAEVLGTGALPLPILEAKIREWIAAGAGGQLRGDGSSGAKAAN